VGKFASTLGIFSTPELATFFEGAVLPCDPPITEDGAEVAIPCAVGPIGIITEPCTGTANGIGICTQTICWVGCEGGGAAGALDASAAEAGSSVEVCPGRTIDPELQPKFGCRVPVGLGVCGHNFDGVFAPMLPF